MSIPTFSKFVQLAEEKANLDWNAYSLLNRPTSSDGTVTRFNIAMRKKGSVKDGPIVGQLSVYASGKVTGVLFDRHLGEIDAYAEDGMEPLDILQSFLRSSTGQAWLKHRWLK